MSYHIESIRLLVRETKPARMAFTLGSQSGHREAVSPLTCPLVHVHLVLRDGSGATTFGCSADRMSVRWLDKRPGRSRGQKLRELVDLLEQARAVYLKQPAFETPFEHWLRCHNQIMQRGRSLPAVRDEAEMPPYPAQEDLTSTFCSALFERALLDATARLAGKPLFKVVREDRLGIEPHRVHPELQGVSLVDHLPQRPVTKIAVRHTVGLADPLTESELTAAQRVNDGLPETLEAYIRRDGLRYFKVKISGDAPRDLERLSAIWDLLPQEPETAITLDANEAYHEPRRFVTFLDALERQLPGLFQHLLYVEQPLAREVSLDPSAQRWIREASQRRGIIIDESDATLDAFPKALRLGYDGTSHKNCKGVFKSLLNRALCGLREQAEKPAILSAEDLQNLPVVPLQQDFVSVGMLGLTHCERNGHHYNDGLSMLSPRDKENVVQRHPDLYVQRGDEWYLNIRDGAIQCASLQVPGFGVADEPDWGSMLGVRDWLERRFAT
jgi:hypothetical protein